MGWGVLMKRGRRWRGIEMDDLSPMAQQIVDYIRKYGGVSFVELERKIEGFKGDLALHLPSYPNLILWPWISPEATDALNSIMGIVEAKPCSLLVYMADGKIPDMQIAKGARDYKSERWLPVVFNIRRRPLKERTTNDKRQR